MKKLALLLSLVLPVFVTPLNALSLNARGQVAAGVGGGIVSVDRTPIAQPAGGVAFITDDQVGYQVCAPSCVLQAYDLRTGTFSQLADRGANAFDAGGGVWAAWLAGYGVFSSNGLRLPDAGLVGVGPDGAVAYVPNYQDGRGIDVRETSGATWRLTDGGALTLQLLGNGRALWQDTPDGVHVRGVPQPVTIGHAWNAHAADFNGEWWIAYWHESGLVLHPFNSTRGYRLTPGDAFGIAVRAVNGKLRIAWSDNQGESPSALHVVDITPSVGREELTVTPPVPPAPPVPPPAPQAGPDPVRARAIVGEVRAKYPTPMTAAQIVTLLKTVAARLNAEHMPGGPYGVLVKTGGTSCEGYSCDIVCSGDGPSQKQYDTLGNADPDTGTQDPGWEGPLSPIAVRPCEIVTGDNPPPPPTDDPRIAALERQVATLTEKLMAALAALDERQTRVNELERERDNITAQRDELQRQLADASKPVSCRVTGAPSWLGRLGIHPRCEIVK